MKSPICIAYLSDPDKPCYHYINPGLCAHPLLFRCIEFIRVKEPTLSYSSMQTFICPRKFWLGHIGGYEAVEKPMPMRLGGLASDILDQLHSKIPLVDNATIGDLVVGFSGKNGFTLDDEGFYPFQVEALHSVFRAYINLNKHAEKGTTQAKFSWHEDGYPEVIGFIDMLNYQDYIGWEFKYTQKDDAYTKFTLQDQLSTYFLAHPKVQRFTVRTILNPVGTIKLSKNEKIDIYRDRVYQDALARPRHYFKDQSYFRNEFDLEQHKAKIRGIADDILRYIEKGQGDMNAFYQKNTPYTCFLQSGNGPAGHCEFLKACETGVISETLYKRREGKVYGPDPETGKVRIE